MKEINYLEIIKEAWLVTWKNKYLWWFGLFLTLGGGLNLNFPGFNGSKEPGKIPDSINIFFSNHWEIISIAIAVVIFLWLIFVVLGIVSKAGLMKTLAKIKKSKDGDFKKGFKEGRKYFWKLVAVNLFLAVSLIALILIFFVPVAMLFYLNAPIFGILATLLAIIIFIPLAVLACFLGKYASFYVVLSDLGIKESLDNSYRLFRKNILSSIVMSLIFIPISLALFLATLILLAFVFLLFLAIGFALYHFLLKTGIMIAVVSGGSVALVFLVIASSIYKVFYQTVWFLFFKEIATIKKEEKIEEAAV